MQQLDFVRCAWVELANDLDVHQCHAIMGSNAIGAKRVLLSRQFIEMRQAQRTAQTDDALNPSTTFSILNGTAIFSPQWGQVVQPRDQRQIVEIIALNANVTAELSAFAELSANY